MVHAGHLFEAYGYSNQGYQVYVASDAGEVDLDHEEQDLISRGVPLSEVERMIRDGEIKDATTIAAFALLRLKGLV
jgi:ADP-ribose pyrophosphatase